MSEQTVPERLAALRAEHYELMVGVLQGYIRLQGDPAIVERALHEAARNELDFAKQQSEAQR